MVHGHERVMVTTPYQPNPLYHIVATSYNIFLVDQRFLNSPVNTPDSVDYIKLDEFLVYIIFSKQIATEYFARLSFFND
mgnify:CR=1 FL=1